MSRKKLPPRLYLDQLRNQWIIRFGDHFKRTGAAGDNREAAEEALARYKNLWRNERTIYVITCLEADFPVKIGSSVDLTGRMSNLATALPYQPVLLASFNGDRTDEAKLHARFADHRLRGEWFRRVPEILEFAASVRKFDNLQAAPEATYVVSRAISAGAI